MSSTLCEFETFKKGEVKYAHKDRRRLTADTFTRPGIFLSWLRYKIHHFFQFFQFFHHFFQFTSSEHAAAAAAAGVH